MKKINITFLFPLIALVSLTYALSSQMFNVPPLGKLLDPFIGAVQNEKEQDFSSTLRVVDKTGLADPVDVFFDSRHVPHIFARNTESLYFAQGYMAAYFRLWQMDFLSYASAGRLSEIFSEGFLDYDRNQRRIGILASAKASLEMMEKDPTTAAVLAAYSRGVNAYIDQLSDRTIPFEYKLLDYRPEPWSSLKSVLLMKYMANTLSGYEEDYSMSNLMLTLGEGDFNKLYPDFHAHITPVMNEAAKSLNPALAYAKKPDYLNNSFLFSGSIVPDNTYNPKLGSNSWAVSGKKTRSGFPILCSDPHLNLSLPSIWLEMQLSAPDVNVYGVSIPGTPSIIIGFNKDIAWGITNGADDVKDWYKLKITGDYRKYELDEKWVDLESSIEEIKRKGQVSFYDTVYHSVQGPVVFDRSFPGRRPEMKNYALKWELHNPSNEFLAFIKLNRASNYDEYKQAIKYYSCPIQNFTFACRDNTIAVDHQGNMAIKWAGEGKFILDGTRSDHIYTKYIPEDSLPHVLNPSDNFVLSANQHPTNASYPYYYNGYYSETRANRIREMLAQGNEFDIKKMESMQLDNTSSFSAEALPVLIGNLDIARLTKEQKEMLTVLRSWKGTYDLEDKNAEFFELWWRNIRDYTWDEIKLLSFSTRMPDDYVLLDLIQRDPHNEYFDVQSTSGKEDAGDIVYEAFVTAGKEYNKMKGQGMLKWGSLHKVNLMHLTNIKAFSSVDIPSAGQSQAINAVSSNWGPSWRMIVELGDRPKAFGVYPGGQSGNIGSRYYDDFVKDWNKGNYYPLTFFISKDEAAAQAKNSWILK